MKIKDSKHSNDDQLTRQTLVVLAVFDDIKPADTTFVHEGFVFCSHSLHKNGS